MTRKLGKKGEKHLFLSDFQIPDQNDVALELIYKFIEDFVPDKIHLVGDILNFTKVAKYDQDPYYHMGMKEEIDLGRKILKNLVNVARKVNPDTEVIWFEGNHENRLIKYLSRNASALAEITGEDGEYVNSIPHLFALRKLGVRWVGVNDRHFEHGVRIEHGNVVRSKAGQTAHAMLDKRGASGLSGHTHRLALIMRTQGDQQRFWIELGSLCKFRFDSPYTIDPDWQNGFAFGYYSSDTKQFYPTIVPILNNTFVANGKLYGAKRK